MTIDLLFSVPVRNNTTMASEIRETLNDLRRRPVTFGAGCGCAVAFSAVSTRDFEEALVFHVSERWRATKAADDPAVPDLSQTSGLNALLDWILTLDGAGRATECRAMLDEVRRSVASFAQQCSSHRFKAENV